MLKVRLHGKREDILRFLKELEYIETEGEIEILNKSELYGDRGASKYERMYLDVEFLNKENG